MIYFEPIAERIKDLKSARLAAADVTEEPPGTLRVSAPVALDQVYIAPLSPELAQRDTRWQRLLERVAQPVMGVLTQRGDLIEEADTALLSGGQGDERSNRCRRPPVVTALHWGESPATNARARMCGRDFEQSKDRAEKKAARTQSVDDQNDRGGDPRAVEELRAPQQLRPVRRAVLRQGRSPIHSRFRLLKKRSTGALSQQFPLRLIDGVMPWCFNNSVPRREGSGI